VLIIRLITSSRRRAISSSLISLSLVLMSSPMFDDESDERFQKATDTHYAAIGNVVAYWAEFELRLQWAIWRLADLDSSIGACITAQIGNSARLIDAIIALLRHKGASEDTIRPLLSFAEEVGKKQRKRNRIIHDPWAFEYPTGEAVRHEVSAQRQLINDLIPQSTIEIEDFAHQIIRLVEELDPLLVAAIAK
jgi:hypothetical protein